MGEGQGRRRKGIGMLVVFVVACCFLLLVDFFVPEIQYCLILFLTSSYVHVMANSLESRGGTEDEMVKA